MVGPLEGDYVMRVMSGISALIKETQRDRLTLSPVRTQ